MAVQNSTVERPTLHAPAFTPADIAAHRAASFVRAAAADHPSQEDEALRRATTPQTPRRPVAA
ncbi:hypothetical protein ACIOYT_00670 [Streptomyces halstedii]|uniref:hypothetical protein n=1 Tax=Streptomyces halstedii TaxID=1944 RepID=UPI0038275C41